MIRDQIFNGTVVDTSGQPIPFATIVSEEDNTFWVTADENGDFSFASTGYHEPVIVSSVGFESSRRASFRLDGNVRLEYDEDNTLDEVVITATPDKKTNIWWWIVAAGVTIGIVSLKNKKKGLSAGVSKKKRAKKSKKKVTPVKRKTTRRKTKRKGLKGGKSQKAII